MAAATTLIAGAGLAMSSVGGASKMIGGARQKRAARNAARQFRRQELRNVHEGRRVSTRGAELATEEMARRTVTSMEALRSGGVRGVVGGVGAVNDANIRQSGVIAADLDRQQTLLDRDIAQDDARIQSMQEARDNMELNAIQQQMNAGNEQMYSGFGDIAQTAFAAGTSGIIPKGDPTPYVDTLTPLKTQGAVTGSALADKMEIKAPVFLG